jgi:uncharacterized protein YggE
MKRATWVLLLTGAMPTFAQSPNSVSSNAQLASGEVMLNVSGIGLQLSKPDIATLTIIISTSGADSAEARATAATKIENVTTDLVAKGVDRQAVQMIPAAGETLGYVGNESFADDVEEPDQAPPSLNPQKAMARRYATAVMQIRLTDMTKIGTVRTVLQDRKGVRILPPVYALLDDTSARRAAVDQALAKARESAGIYAKALNMRIKAVVGVMEVAGDPGVQNDFLQMLNSARAQASSVRTTAKLEMHLILAPL